MKLYRYTLQALTAALLATAPVTFAATNPTSADAISLTSVPQAFKSKTVVLVHGFFADGSGWEGVIERLQALHINVVAVQDPLSSLTTDVEATRRVIDEQPGDVVLVGHSYGGFVITNAGLDPKVVSLVYVAAFAPEVGESVASLSTGYAPHPWQPELVADDAGYVKLTEADYVKYFAPDLPRWQAQALSAVQIAPPGSGFAQPAVTAAWHARPTWYVLAEDDLMIDPNLQRFMSARMNAKVTQVHSSHSVMVSHPDLVTDVIIDAFLHR
jgi:pimeloyl-ACP methyl ester carboxylesterase